MTSHQIKEIFYNHQQSTKQIVITHDVMLVVQVNQRSSTDSCFSMCRVNA